MTIRVKIRIMAITMIAVMLGTAVPVYASVFQYSEKQKQELKEAGLWADSSWEEIDRRQKERRKRLDSKKKAGSVQISENTTTKKEYGSKNSYDEFHTAPVDVPANDGYRSGSFDELHINENYSQNVWHPEDRGGRLNGFDEFHYPDEM